MKRSRPKMFPQFKYPRPQQIDMQSQTTPYSLIFLELAQSFRIPDVKTSPDLSKAYCQLFLGPGRPIAHLYESTYLEGSLFGETTVQVQQMYAQSGLRIPESQRELPDHLSFELAYMAHLTFQEERDPANSSLWRTRQLKFLRGHLGRWLPELCNTLEQNNAHPFYLLAAQTAKLMVERNLERLSPPAIVPKVEEHERINSSSSFRATNQSSLDLPASFPNVRLMIGTTKCTLCTLCVDQCDPGALSVERSPTSLNLLFNPAQCNGCRKCLRFCPEDAIKLELGPPLLTRSSLVPGLIMTDQRIVCPKCQRPHISETWLERLAERMGAGESVRMSLTLCPLCKNAPGNRNSSSFGFPKELSNRAS